MRGLGRIEETFYKGQLELSSRTNHKEGPYCGTGRVSWQDWYRRTSRQRQPRHTFPLDAGPESAPAAKQMAKLNPPEPRCLNSLKIPVRPSP